MYDYTKVEYKNNHTKVCIICPVHGEFWQTPNSHLNGRGCKQCRRSHLEYEVKMILDKHKIDYTYQYRNKNIFKQQSLDFYIKDCRIAIEYQGEQHFISNFYKSKGIEYSEKHLEYIMSLDEKKKKICQDNNILLVYFLNKKFNKYLKENDLYANDENGLIEIIKNIKIMR